MFEAPAVVERFEKMGDLHAPVLELKQKLPDLRGCGGRGGCATGDCRPGCTGGGRASPNDEECADKPSPKKAAARPASRHPRRQARSLQRRNAGRYNPPFGR